MFTVKSVIYRHVETEIIYFTEIPRTNLVVPIKDKSMFFLLYGYNTQIVLLSGAVHDKVDDLSYRAENNGKGEGIEKLLL